MKRKKNRKGSWKVTVKDVTVKETEGIVESGE